MNFATSKTAEEIYVSYFRITSNRVNTLAINYFQINIFLLICRDEIVFFPIDQCPKDDKIDHNSVNFQKI